MNLFYLSNFHPKSLRGPKNSLYGPLGCFFGVSRRVFAEKFCYLCAGIALSRSGFHEKPGMCRLSESQYNTISTLYI